MDDTIREPFNAISHAVASIASLVGLIVLLVVSQTPLQYVASLTYGLSLVFLYTSSSLFHGLGFKRELRNLLCKLDHLAIYFLIAGSATPVALLIMDNTDGWMMFYLLWGLAIAGGAFSLIRPVDSPYLRCAIYITLGWIPIYFIDSLLVELSARGLLLAAAGGVVYTVGAMIYMFDWPTFSSDYFGAHELWHLFTIAASLIHFVFIATYAY